MSLTRTEQLLITGLKVFEVKKGMAVAIFMTLQDESQMWEMMEYMAAHKGATADELLDQARIIARKFDLQGGNLEELAEVKG